MADQAMDENAWLRVEQAGPCTLYLGDCRRVLPTIAAGNVDLVIADPPYGETSLEWDRRLLWQPLVARVLSDRGSLWCFGSLRYFLESAREFEAWSVAQDVVWEKHNGTNPFNDRFRRVHENAVQFYKRGVPWSDVYKHPLFTHDATARTVRRKKRPPQWGDIGASHYTSLDGGPRLMRSVMFCRSCHGFAVHPTQKPVETVVPLIEYSSPAGAMVLDPAMGSGTTAVACIRTERRFVGIEIDPVYFGEAVRRCREELARFPLFDRDTRHVAGG